MLATRLCLRSCKCNNHRRLMLLLILVQARELVAACKEAGGVSVINDRVDVALAAGADGVHVGQASRILFSGTVQKVNTSADGGRQSYVRAHGVDCRRWRELGWCSVCMTRASSVSVVRLDSCKVAADFRACVAG